uniref:Uncharacterized protein n=1 Tax=Micrurus lemniscatus lemniscatus TaxID=129467 RepID=A0A2D4IC53_MICLE
MQKEGSCFLLSSTNSPKQLILLLYWNNQGFSTCIQAWNYQNLQSKAKHSLLNHIQKKRKRRLEMDFFSFIFSGHDSEKHSECLVASVSFPFYSETLHTQTNKQKPRNGVEVARVDQRSSP